MRTSGKTDGTLKKKDGGEGMLSFVQLDKPHIDIELYGTDTNIAPIDKVHIMDEDSFETFTLEWLFGIG